MLPMKQPHYDRDVVRRLTADSATFAMDARALADALGLGMDDEEVRAVFQRIDEWDFVKTEPTRKKYPNTISDYYVYYVDECMCRVFIKFVVAWSQTTYLR